MTETKVTPGYGRVTIPGPSGTLEDPIVESTMIQLVEVAGHLLASRNAPSSGLTGPYGMIDDTGRMELSGAVEKRTDARSTTAFERRQRSSRQMRKIPLNKLSRVLEVIKVETTIRVYKILIHRPVSTTRSGARQ